MNKGILLHFQSLTCLFTFQFSHQDRSLHARKTHKKHRGSEKIDLKTEEGRKNRS